MITSKIVVSLDKWLGRRCFFLKCRSMGPTSEVDLVRCMQLGGGLQNCWLMFNHVKHVQEWTTMAFMFMTPCTAKCSPLQFVTCNLNP